MCVCVYAIYIHVLLEVSCLGHIPVPNPFLQVISRIAKRSLVSFLSHLFVLLCFRYGYSPSAPCPGRERLGCIGFSECDPSRASLTSASR